MVRTAAGVDVDTKKKSQISLTVIVPIVVVTVDYVNPEKSTKSLKLQLYDQFLISSPLNFLCTGN